MRQRFGPDAQGEAIDTARVESDKGVQSAVAETGAQFNGSGCVLLRKSGTEPGMRVTVETATKDDAQLVANRLVKVVQDHLTP